MPAPTWPSGTSASDYHGPWRASSTPSGVSYYYNGSTGGWLSYNSSTGATSVPTNTSALNTTFGSLVSSASAATGPAVTASASAATTAASPSTAASAGTTTPYYPEDLATTKQDRIKFEMYAPAGERTITTTSSGSSSISSAASSGSPIATVFLGIQGQLSDSNGVDWSGMTLNPLQMAAAGVAIEAMGGRSTAGYHIEDLTKDLGKAAGKLLGKTAQLLKDNLAANNRQIQILLAQEAVQAQGLLSRLTGQVANPNLELLFNGPTLRPFNFNFRMAPRSSTEAANVKKIIRFFKKGMAVQGRTGDTFLKSPNVFRIQFLAGDNTKHTSLPRLKTCALIGCDVNYTPDGSYMTFADRDNGYPMTCYEMTLRFSELEPIYANDYDATADYPEETSIGY